MPQIAEKIVGALMETGQESEYGSATINVTWGPKEAPVILAAILPGTTKENALRIQSEFMKKGAEVNEG